MAKLVWPDYENCIANLPNSVMKKFGVETVGKSLPLLDQYMDCDYKNIVVLLLDGMGEKILNRHLAEDGPFRSHVAGIYNSTFLSTTVAATTSVMSGLQPCEHAWLGWECYYPQLDENVVVFLNRKQCTEDQVADYNVAWTLTPYESAVNRLNRFGKEAHMLIKFTDPSLDTIEDICDRIQTLCAEPGQRYIYAYWNQPDGILHRNGCGSDEAHEEMLHLEKVVSELAERLTDTLFVITADHGHRDTDYVLLKDYPQLCECLKRWPSLEPRALNFFVKEEKKDFFVQEFNRLFGDKFLLMPMEEVLEKNLMGTGKHHPMFRSMLGDYLAIATDDLTIYYSGECWKSMHGSLTEDEMRIPLIIFR